MLFETIYKLRVIYKSGYALDFEVIDYEIMIDYEISPSTAKWTNANDNFRPININYDEVASVWKVGQRSRLKKFW